MATASPLALYGGVPDDARAFTWRTLPGLLLDRSFGLLPFAPVFLLALAGLPAILRRRAAWPHALVGLAVLAPVLTWRMWWGGQCPPARFLVPMTPFLAVALALRLARPRAGLARWAPGLLLTGAVLGVVAVADPAARVLLNRGNRPTRLWAACRTPSPVGDYLPTLTHPSERDARLALVWLGALLLLLALDRLAQVRPRIDRVFSSFAAAVMAALLMGVAIDLDRGPACRRGAGLRPEPAGEPADGSRGRHEVLDVAEASLLVAYAATRLVGLARLPAFVDENLHVSWAMHITQGERLASRGPTAAAVQVFGPRSWSRGRARAPSWPSRA